MLRVLFVTENDSLYVVRFFEVFLQDYPRDEFELVGITIHRAFREPLWRTARRVFRLYGPVDFVRLGVRFVLAKLSGVGIANLARRASVPAIPTESVNDPGYVERVRALKADIIVSVAAPEIFRTALLESARLGCINIHSGRLPRYRGMLPSFWQMRNGESHATVTIHQMAERLDAGAVIATAECPIRSQDSLDRVMTEAKREGARLMIQTLREISQGRTTPRALNMNGAGYFSFPGREDVRAFRKRGHRLL